MIDLIACVSPLVKHHEGFRDKPYRDTVGKLTIGYGWNLDDVPMSRAAAEFVMREELQRCDAALITMLGEDYTGLSAVRKCVLLDMTYNLGTVGISKFRATLAAIRAKDFERAATQMLSSLWAKQVKSRAIRLAEMMRSNQWPSDVPGHG